jgi:GNAT superfamily N-acetyltransferase
MLQTMNPITDVALKLRPGIPADAEICGQICFDAFKTISEQHNFPPDFPDPAMLQGLMAMVLGHPQVYSVVAEVAGQIVGSNFLWEESMIAGVGPLSVAPAAQNAALGRRLMTAVLDRAEQQGLAGVRLVQAAFHNRSLSLYAKLGFDVQEPLANLQGSALNLTIPGYRVRPATEADLAGCDRLCLQVHGFSRSNELRRAIAQGIATVVEHNGQIVGYSTSVSFLGHSVGVNNEALKALIGAALAFDGPGFLLPTRNSSLFRWCLEQGLRVVQPMTLMSLGLYNQPAGTFLPSIFF